MWILVVILLGTAWMPGVAGQAAGTAAPTSHEAFGGVWSLNRDKSEMPGRGGAEGGRAGGRPEGGGAPGGGPRGGGFGGGRGGSGGRMGGGGSRSPEEMQEIMGYAQSMMEASSRITVVVHPASVGITDAEGRTVMLQTDDKKLDERAANGLVKLKRKSRWEGAMLVSEIEIEDGPKIERRYKLSAGGEELRVSTTMSGASGRGGRGDGEVTQVYERWREQ
jgi:hypothetical protein